MSYELYKDKLTEENLIIFNEIEYYGMTHTVDSDFSSERLDDLMDNFLEAQNRGDDISFIVGQDIKLFCKEFYDDYTVQDRLLSMLKRFRFLALIGLVLEIINPGSFLVGSVLIGILLSMVGMTAILMVISFMVKKNKKFYKQLDNIICIGAIAILAVSLILIINTEFEIKVPSYILIPFFSIYLFLGYAIPAYNNFRRYGSVYVRKEKDVPSLDTDFIKEWAKEASKKNYTQEQWIQKLDKRYSNKYEKITCIACIVLGIILFVPRFFDGDFATSVGALAGLYVGYKGYQFMDHTMTQARETYKKVKQIIIEEDLTIQEYAKRIK